MPYNIGGEWWPLYDLWTSSQHGILGLGPKSRKRAVIPHSCPIKCISTSSARLNIVENASVNMSFSIYQINACFSIKCPWWKLMGWSWCKREPFSITSQENTTSMGRTWRREHCNVTFLNCFLYIIWGGTGSSWQTMRAGVCSADILWVSKFWYSVTSK